MPNELGNYKWKAEAFLYILILLILAFLLFILYIRFEERVRNNF